MGCDYGSKYRVEIFSGASGRVRKEPLIPIIGSANLIVARPPFYLLTAGYAGLNPRCLHLRDLSHIKCLLIGVTGIFNESVRVYL